MCAVRCYILHQKRDLYRWAADNTNSHFITPVIHDGDDENAEDNDDDKIDNESSNKSMFSINTLLYHYR